MIAALLLRLGVFKYVLAGLLAISAVFGPYLYGRHVANSAWEAKMSDYKERVTADNKTANVLLGRMDADHAILVSELQKRLSASEARKQETITIIKRVKEYVTEKADAHCTITDGFVWMSNLPLHPEDASVSVSKPADADAPTGVKLSEVAASTASNYAECVARGEVIVAWQEWYHSTRETWDKVRAAMPPPTPIP